MGSSLLSAAIIIPAYKSEKTIIHCLETMASQSYAKLDLVVVDSSPTRRVEEIIHSNFPNVTYLHSKERLLPHAARNVGARKTSSDLLIFTDPDVYAPADWVEQLVKAYQQYGGVVIGSLANHTNRWLDWGIHLGKFDSFLPEDDAHPLNFCATANMLCSRSDFERAGGFEDQEMLGDLVISWRFEEERISITLVPPAVVEHHHTQGFADFLRERFVRGMDFGRLRVEYFRWSKWRIFQHLLVTISGFRLVGLIIREGRHSRRARLFTKLLLTLPVSCAGQISWLWGETLAFIRALTTE
jgi:GT2 family glycosyltransferase